MNASGGPPPSVHRAREQFARLFGRPPDGVWAAPGRVNLIGEHTDYQDGFVLPLALDRVTLAAVGRRGDGRARCVSDTLGAAAEVRLSEVSPRSPPEGWSAYPVGAAWALAQLGVETGGFDLLVSSDVPAGAGLSSSAALTCSVALALSDLAGAGLDRAALASAARRAENEIARAPTGVMDQMVSMLGRPGHALFLDCRTGGWRHVPCDFSSSGLSLLVLDTRTRHALVGGRYGDRRRACEEAARTLGLRSLRDADETAVGAARGRLGEEGARLALHVVTENARVLAAVALLTGAAVIREEAVVRGAGAAATGEAVVAGAGDAGAIGPLLSASHASLRDRFQVSCPELDNACASAEAAGALGARMTGGGFGGSAIALTPAGRVAAVTAAVIEAAQQRGFPAPSVFEARAADGARRAG